MAQFTDNIKHSDVSLWGVIVLICGAIAILSANLPSLISQNLSTSLHSTRYDGTSLNNLRSQVAQLQSDAMRMQNEYNRMTTMLKLAEQRRGEVTRRVGAMESSLPLLLEAIPPGVKVDSLITTAGINENKEAKIEGEGGYAMVSSSPMEGVSAPTQLETPAMPQSLSNKSSVIENTQDELIIGSASEFGIALGSEIVKTDAFVTWQDIERKVGLLLLGLEPILSVSKNGEKQRLIAGPIEDYAQAEQLCTRMIRVGISCLPVTYEGVAMPK